MIGYLSSGIDRIPHLQSFVGVPCQRISINSVDKVSSVAGWGLKNSSVNAQRIAEKYRIPYISLEDGFLRSLGLGVEGALQHSLIVDQSGIYYDATRSSDLEQLILSATVPNSAELQRSERCMQMLLQYRLSKYNHAPDYEIPVIEGKSRVLVVDQTVGDVSVKYGMATDTTFHRMLNTAVLEHPDAEIFVKVHPDVIAGKKKSYLLELAKQFNCRILSSAVNPWAVLDIVQHVYVVTSQLGFEALLANKKVTCFGLPFYSGWGLTDDRQQCKRRGVKRSLAQVFHAAYIKYCRYVNPYSGLRCELEDTIRLIYQQKRHLECYRGEWLAGGFSCWKKASYLTS